MKRLITFLAATLVGALPILAQDAAKKTLPNKLPAAKMQQLRAELPAVIDKAIAALEPKVKSIVEEYAKQPAFPNQDQRLVGIWHGVSEDATLKSFWHYERRADGTMRSEGRDLMTDSREYDDFGFDIVWMTRGRVIFEHKASEPETIDTYLLESLEDDKIKYRIVFDDESVEAWTGESDTRGYREFPKPPVGWKKFAE